MTILGNASLSKFDVLVIGSGAGGAPVADMLCKNGQKVLVLEAGRNWFDGLDDPTRQPVSRFSNDEVKMGRHFISPDPVVDPRTWRTAPSDGDRTFVGDVNALPKTVGGGAVHADLKTPRFIPQDFQLGTLLGPIQGANFADWPVTFDQIEPFYAYTEKAIGVQGTDGLNPFDGKRSTPFPMAAGVPMYCAVKVVDGAKSLGYHPYPFPGAINTRPYDDRPACVDCGFCSGYGCPSNAKGSPAVTMLRKALLSGNCQLLSETKVTRLLLNGAKNAVVGVEAIGPDGTKATYTADRYVLAASPIEDARLLFLTDPAGAGNSSGSVGRNLTFHLETNAVGIFSERVHGHRGRTVSHCMSDFRGAPNDPMHPLGGIVEISGSETLISEAQYYLYIMKVLGFDGARLKAMMRQSPGRDRIVALSMKGEDAPQLTNRVDLDPAVRDLDGLPVARCTYANHALELASRNFYLPKMLDLLGASKASYAIPAPIDTIPGSAHIMGTLRFGPDPKTSVCDPTGRFHDIGNLYASDGSLFPTSSGFNPTLTVMALSTFVAAGMVFPGAPQKGIS